MKRCVFVFVVTVAGVTAIGCNNSDPSTSGDGGIGSCTNGLGQQFACMLPFHYTWQAARDACQAYHDAKAAQGVDVSKCDAEKFAGTSTESDQIELKCLAQPKPPATSLSSGLAVMICWVTDAAKEDPNNMDKWYPGEVLEFDGDNVMTDSFRVIGAYGRQD